MPKPMPIRRHSSRLTKWRLTTGLAALGCGLWLSAAWAAPVANGQRIRDFARISFEWAQSTTLSTRMEGRNLVVTFDRRASEPDFSRLMARLPDIVKSARLAEDGRTLTLTLDKPYRTRSFISGRLNGVDLLGVAPAKEIAAALEKPAPKQAEPKKSAPEKTAPEAPKARTEAKPALQVVPTLRPSSPIKEAPAEPAKAGEPTKAEPTKQVAAAPAATPEPPKPATESVPAEPAKPEPIKAEPTKPEPIKTEAATPETPAAAPAPLATAPGPIKESAPQSPAAPAAPPLKLVQDAAPAQSIAVALQAKMQDGKLVLTFPVSQRTALAAFRRGTVDWLVFDHPLAVKADELRPFSALVPELVVAHEKDTTILRLITPSQEGLTAEQTPQGGWQVTIATVAQWPAEPLVIQAHTDSAIKPYLLAAALETSLPLNLTDPLVGDRLLVVPSYTPGQGVAPGRDLVDVQILQTAQGLAMVPHGAMPSVVAQRNGLRIGAPEGLHLTPDLPSPPAASEQGAEPPRVSMFPAAEWLPEGGITLEAFKSTLTPMMLTQSPATSEARLRLAQAYLALGLSAEALGMVELTHDSDPDFYLREHMSALSGLANFLMDRLDEAARDFAAPELGSSEEVEYWRTALAELTGRSSQLFDYKHWYARYMAQYPPRVRARLGIIAADRLVAANRFNEAIAVINNILRDKPSLDANTSHAMDYFLGEIYARTGYPDKALERWKPLIADMDDRYWRARAEFGLINMEQAQGKLKDEEVVERLDHLRILWRDDPIELEVLKQLGTLYMKQKNYLQALRTLREITQAYPNSAAAFTAAGQMADAFRYLFNEDGTKDMKPLEALALFYEFKDLTPVEAEGDVMIRHLADRLAEVDLLDRAAALLDHQVRYRLQGEERSRVGARLALIHLLNRQPKQALSVLESTGYGANPAELQQQRALLTARALADLHEGDRAVALLDEDVSPAAQLLKIDVYWDQGKWDKLIGVAESYLGQRRDPTAQLSETEMGALLKLAVAYSFQKDTGQLRYLRDFFTPLVQNNPQKDLFAFLTADTPATPEGVAQLAESITKMQGFLSSYRTRIHDEGLSGAVK